MGLIYAITFASLFWLTWWATGHNAIPDATLLAAGIVVVAVAINSVLAKRSSSKR